MARKSENFVLSARFNNDEGTCRFPGSRVLLKMTDKDLVLMFLVNFSFFVNKMFHLWLLAIKNKV